MSTAPDSTEPGDSLRWVLGAYFAALLPWTVLYAHDFISDKWRTVRHSRRVGYLHIGILLLPLPVVIYYTVLQVRAKDFKEMAMGVTAIVFSIYHLVRSCWGLCQLHYFTTWARNASKSFKSLGYERQEFEVPSERFGNFPKRFNTDVESVECMYVNSSLIDNEIYGGNSVPVGIMLSGKCWVPVRLFLYRKAEQLKALARKTDTRILKEALQLIAGLMYYRLAPSEHPPIYGDKERITIEDIAHNLEDLDPNASLDAFGTRGVYHTSCLGQRITACYETGPLRLTLYPKDPEDLWVRWAVTYISQRAVHWKSECVHVPPKLRDDGYVEFVRAFIRLQDVVPLRFWRRFSANVFDPTLTRTGSSFGHWVTRYSLRYAILESIFETGKGLPFAFPSPLYLLDNCMFNVETQHLISQSLSSARQKESLLGAGLTPAHLELFAFITCISSWEDARSSPDLTNVQNGREILLPAPGYAPLTDACIDRVNMRADNWASLRAGSERCGGIAKDLNEANRSKLPEPGIPFTGYAMRRLWVSLLRNCFMDELLRPIPVQVVEVNGAQREVEFEPTEQLYEEILHEYSNRKDEDKSWSLSGHVKLRILEESQNSLLGLWNADYNGVPSREVSGNSIEAVLFCILAYPTLTIRLTTDSEQHSESGNVGKKRCPHSGLIVRIFSEVGPQNLCVDVEFALNADKTKQAMPVAVMRLANYKQGAVSADDGNDRVGEATGGAAAAVLRFDWQLWKDSFVRAMFEHNTHGPLPAQLSKVTASAQVANRWSQVIIKGRRLYQSVVDGRLNGKNFWKGWELWSTS